MHVASPFFGFLLKTAAGRNYNEAKFLRAFDG
jgi:hypothetical protein